MVDASANPYVMVIDQELCAGHGRCYGVAPDTFTPDDRGYGAASGRVERGRTIEQLREIAAVCPEEAISIRTPADQLAD